MKFERAIYLIGLLFGLATPAAAQTGPVSGYMELHLNNVEAADATLDLHRFVLLVSHSFSPRIRFIGEVEIEHAFVEGLEESGELEIEQAYLDFLITRAFNVRAGILLVPMGIINERHEPPSFQGVERPFVDTVIIPSTWFDGGAGVHGEIGLGFRYRAYVMAPLNATGFSADDGLRDSAQHGSEANVRHAAIVARGEYIGFPRVTIGASYWDGQSNFAVPGVDARVRIGEADVRVRRNRLELRGEFAYTSVGDAAALNRSIQQTTGVSPNIASAMRGFYGEAAYRVWAAGPAKDVVAFVRYENYDTQYKMPSGFLPLKEFDRSAWVTGATYYPDPDVAVKVDYVWQRNQSTFSKAPNSFNVGLGWWF